MKVVRFAVILCLLFMVTGCASKLMAPLPVGQAAYEKDPEKAVVVFYRPSAFGGAVQSTLYEINGEAIDFVAILSYHAQVAYQVDPGEKLFMVVGENSGYMKAQLEKNKVYYARVSPQLGFFKAGFSLNPVTLEEMETEEFQKDLSVCAPVMNTPESEAWYADNSASIARKHKFYYPKWLEKADEKKAVLHAEDGKPY